MWTWLSIAILIRVLLASNEPDFQVANLNRQRQAMPGYSSGVEFSEESSQPTIKPIPNNDQLLCKEGEIFQGGGGGGDPVGADGSALYNGKIPLYASMNIGGLASVLRTGKSIESLSKCDEVNKNKGKRSPREFSNLDSPPGSWIPLTNLGDKTPGIFQERAANPWQEIKKSRAFSPWGGKRVAVLGQGSKVRRPIRVPFNSWGGKRGYDEGPTNIWRSGAEDDLQKRTRFSSWGGKRGFNLGEKVEENGNELIEKRTKFNAWGGKRSKNGERDEEEIKRTRFNAWGGKRSDLTEKRTPEEVFAKKSVFNAWGGKRFATQGKTSLGENDLYSRLIERGNENGLSFGSLGAEGEGGAAQPRLRELIETLGGGKYMEEEAIDPKVYSNGEIMPLPDKREGGKHFQRSYFNPWGGKKRSLQGEGTASVGHSFPPVATDLEPFDRQAQLSSWEG